MTLNELKQKAEAAKVKSTAWFDWAELSLWLERADITTFPDEDAKFIVAASPATVLKLLEMIGALRDALSICANCDKCQTHAAIAAYECERADEIERSFGD